MQKCLNAAFLDNKHGTNPHINMGLVNKFRNIHTTDVKRMRGFYMSRVFIWNNSQDILLAGKQAAK